MSISVKLEDGRFSFRISCLFERLTLEEKQDVIQYLSCDSDVTREVCAQIVDGMTSEGWHGPLSCSADVEPNGAIEKARRTIVEALDQMAKREIEQLKDALRREKENCAHWIAEWHKALGHN